MEVDLRKRADDQGREYEDGADCDGSRGKIDHRNGKPSREVELVDQASEEGLDQERQKCGDDDRVEDAKQKKEAQGDDADHQGDGHETACGR